MARDCIFVGELSQLVCGYVIYAHTFSMEALSNDKIDIYCNAGVVGEGLGVAL